MDHTKEIKVLDHGYVKYIAHMGSDREIVADARISTNQANKTDEEDKKLLNYLVRHHHTSPLESPVLRIEMQIPIFVLRELDRHRTLLLVEGELQEVSTVDNSSRQYVNKNELSGRYAAMPNINYIPTKERLGGQGKINKQGTDGELSAETKDVILASFKVDQDTVRQNYEDNLRLGLSRELARIDLGLSQYTKIRTSANLLNWLKFFNLRLRANAQYEIRVYAEAIASIVKEIFPWSYEAFEEYMYHATTFSKSEMDVLKAILSVVDDHNITPALQHLNWPRSRIEEFLNKLSKNPDNL